MTDWQQPLVSVDVVAVRRSGVQLQFATHTRRLEPFAGRAALPGVLLLAGESLDAAARRAVRDKLDWAGEIIYLAQIGAFDGANRDPRGATIAVGHLAVLAEAGAAASWSTFDEHAGLPFDHDTIVAAARTEVSRRLWSDLACTRAVLGERFSTSEMIAFTKHLGARLPAPETNLSRWLKASGLVVKIGLRGRDTEWGWEQHAG